MRTLGVPACVLSLMVAAAPSVAAQESRVRLEGSGYEVTDPFDLEGGLVVVSTVHRGSSLLIVKLLNLDGDRDKFGDHKQYAVVASGDYAGTRLLPVEAGRYRFEIQANGPWVVTYEPASGGGTPLPVSAARNGEAPLGPLALEAGLVTAALSHDGDSNFIVALYHADGRLDGHLVNEIGVYEGRVSYRVGEAGLYWIQIRARGNWTLAMDVQSERHGSRCSTGRRVTTDAPRCPRMGRRRSSAYGSQGAPTTRTPGVRSASDTGRTIRGCA